jgi:predicted kinase
MEKLELVILVGIQASGKTTFYRRHMQGRYLHVSLDNWRGKGNVRGKEHEAILAGLRAAAEGGQELGVVVDNTNITAAARKRYFDYAREFAGRTGLALRVLAYFFDADLQACLKRNEQRPAEVPAGTPYYVPAAAIRRFHSQLEPPTHQEGFAEVFRVRIADDGQFQVERLSRPAGRAP